MKKTILRCAIKSKGATAKLGATYMEKRRGGERVTTEQKREWLGGYLKLRREMDDLRERAQKLRAEAERMSVRLTGLPGGGPSDDRLQRCAAELADLEREYTAAAAVCAVRLRSIERAVRRLKDPVQRVIVRARHLDGLTWEQIAEKFHYSERSVRYIEGKALERIKPQTRA